MEAGVGRLIMLALSICLSASLYICILICTGYSIHVWYAHFLGQRTAMLTNPVTSSKSM